MFLHTVYRYSNAVYESLRFGALKSDSIHHFFGNVRLIAVLSVFQLLYDLVNFCITIICGVIVLGVVSQHEYQYIQSCLYLPGLICPPVPIRAPELQHHLLPLNVTPHRGDHGHLLPASPTKDLPPVIQALWHTRAHIESLGRLIHLQ